MLRLHFPFGGIKPPATLGSVLEKRQGPVENPTLHNLPSEAGLSYLPCRAKKPRQRNIQASEAIVFGQYLELPVGDAPVPKPG